MKAFCLLKRRVWMIPILLFCFALSGIAQTIKITGRVIDTNGEPLAGVLVKMDGTSAATTTDADGRYSINASNQDAVSLMFSYVGCVPQTVKLSKGQKVCDVQMQDATSALGEVVVVGYGVQKKANLTGAGSSVNMNDIQDIPVSNTASLLQGRMSGVTVSSFSAQPGNDDDVEIRIRGIGTFGDSNPLSLSDGVEGTLSQIPASDIESISVLKDAASAAIYGLRAANGVILVTTKSG